MYLALIVTATILLCGLRVCVDGGEEWKGSWSMRAAEEAERVAAQDCSGHGRAYLDGLVLHGHGYPTCECNSCYAGSDCSHFLPDCELDVQSGEPLFLEPFWMKHAASSAILISGWHRMGYAYSDGSLISELLVNHILKVHDIVGNAVTKGRYILFGSGSTQLLSAAVHALAPNSSLVPPAKVVVTPPYYPLYKIHTEIFNSVDYRFGDDASLWKNSTDNDSTRFIEFVTSPNNPDGKLNKPILNGPNVRTIYDHAYYWPHYTAIPAPADEDLMIFSMSKFTGHASLRFGWALIKDEEVYQKMLTYIYHNTVGVSRDAQLRALKIFNVILDHANANENGIFEFAYNTMEERWMRLRQIISNSKRFSLQKLDPHYCSFFKRVRDPSPAYAWMKCEREEDENCYEILKEAHIHGLRGSYFGGEDRFVRLSLIGIQDDFETLIKFLRKLVSEEQGPQQVHQTE